MSHAVFALQWYQVENWIITWAPIIFMGLLVFFLWRTMKLMPKTKPTEITPDSDSAVEWAQVAGADQLDVVRGVLRAGVRVFGARQRLVEGEAVRLVERDAAIAAAVGSAAQKTEAEQVAKSVEGVKSVKNELKVAPNDSMTNMSSSNWNTHGNAHTTKK